MIRVMILWGLGINCEEETQAAYKLAGAHTTLVHVNELLREQYRVHDFDLIHFPGGFSFGDHLGAGRVLTNRLRFKKTSNGKSFREELLDFTKNGGFIFGVCNGFQILTSLGLLPFAEDEVKVSLVQNTGGNYQDRWVPCRFDNSGPLKGLWPSEDIYLPIRHGEGRLLVADDETAKLIQKDKLVAMRYVGENPNGSYDACAALSDPSGRILGMMPHPEAFLSSYNHPQWCGRISSEQKGQGLNFFENLINYLGA